MRALIAAVAVIAGLIAATVAVTTHTNCQRNSYLAVRQGDRTLVVATTNPNCN